MCGVFVGGDMYGTLVGGVVGDIYKNSLVLERVCVVDCGVCGW